MRVRIVGLAALWIGAAWGQTTTSLPEQVSVSVPADKSYTGKAFGYARTFRERNHRHEVYDVRYPSPVVSPHEENNTVPGELYLPLEMKAGQKFPAVVCLHIIHDNFDLERMLCTRLA